MSETLPIRMPNSRTFSASKLNQLVIFTQNISKLFCSCFSAVVRLRKLEAYNQNSIDLMKENAQTSSPSGGETNAHTIVEANKFVTQMMCYVFFFSF